MRRSASRASPRYACFAMVGRTFWHENRGCVVDRRGNAQLWRRGLCPRCEHQGRSINAACKMIEIGTEDQFMRCLRRPCAGCYVALTSRGDSAFAARKLKSQEREHPKNSRGGPAHVVNYTDTLILMSHELFRVENGSVYYCHKLGYGGFCVLGGRPRRPRVCRMRMMLRRLNVDNATETYMRRGHQGCDML